MDNKRVCVLMITNHRQLVIYKRLMQQQGAISNKIWWWVHFYPKLMDQDQRYGIRTNSFRECWYTTSVPPQTKSTLMVGYNCYFWWALQSRLPKIKPCALFPKIVQTAVWWTGQHCGGMGMTIIGITPNWCECPARNFHLWTNNNLTINRPSLASKWSTT